MKPRPGSSLPRPLRAVSFDCWNTLLVERNWTAAHARRVEALGEAARRCGRDPSPEALLGAFDAAWNRHILLWTRGVATGAPEIAQHAFTALDLPDDEAALGTLVEHWQEASHSGAVAALDGAAAALEALCEAGLRLALICDTGLTPGRVVRRHLEREGLLRWLDTCVFSDEVGVPKPDPRPFHTALEALGARPGEGVHVGDLLRTDVAGARGVGMGSIRLAAAYDDPSELPEADHVVGSHAELLALLLDGRR